MTRTACWEKEGGGKWNLCASQMYVRAAQVGYQLPGRSVGAGCNWQVTGRQDLIHGRSRLMGMQFQ